MDAGELQRHVDDVRWYHSIDLGHGIVTPGVEDSKTRFARLALPADLSGKTVLDVGAWDGYFSFECERRGAARVLAIDSYAWSGAAWGSKAGFLLARRALGSSVEDRELEVLDISPETTGTFDIVLFLGVLYHMRHPLLALEHVASVTDGCLVLETQVDLMGLRRPAAAFYPGAELNRDDTNWWGPNPAAVEAMLRTVGFETVEAVWPPYGLLLRTARAAKWAAKGRNSFVRGIRQARMIVHASR